MRESVVKIRSFTLGMMTVMLSLGGYAQDPTDSLPGDPGAIYVTTSQNLSFGAFAKDGTGGTVLVSNTGGRSSSGGIILINQGGSFFQAVIDVEAVPGSLISITNGPDAVLTGSNGGSISLEIGDSDPPSPYNTSIAPPGRTSVNIGGKLTIGNSTASPPGNYTGIFYITFNQE